MEGKEGVAVGPEQHEIASQWPGVRRSAASAGRSARGRRWAMKAAALRPLARRRPRLLLAWGR